MKQISFYLSCFLGLSLGFAQNEDAISKNYEKAYLEIEQMLRGDKPIDFKKAIFLAENAYHNNTLYYQNFDNQIKTIAQKCKQMIAKKGLGKDKTAANWAVFTYMTEKIAENNFKPFTYDFEDFTGAKDWTKQFVDKLLKSKTGNCHSLPVLYKILINELGANANLALAPNHLYIKHLDENGKWANIELTSGSFPSDGYIMTSLGINMEAVKKETYMHPLDEKQEIAVCLFDLAQGYIKKRGYDDFVLKCADTALLYYPNFIYAFILKSEYYRAKTQEIMDKNGGNRNDKTEAFYQKYAEISQIIGSLGHSELSDTYYNEWVNTLGSKK